MKKTLTVNLGGIVFNIDEDAYELLDKYLINLRSHFIKQEEKEEVMHDIEVRISELFGEQIARGYQVISIEYVEQVIKRMGKPEQIFENEYLSDEEQKETSNTAYTEERVHYKKRLMRDSDDKILGGVASGLSVYLSIDVTAVRLALIVLLFFFSTVTLPVYLVLWMVMPLARTATDKLQMRGESINMENIGKTVTEGFESSYASPHAQVDNRTGLQRFADGFVSVIGFILKALGIIIGIILIPPLLLVLFILLVVTMALLFGGLGALFSFVPFVGNNFEFMQDIPTYLSAINSISAIFLIGIPVVALIYLLCGNWLKLPPMKTTAKWILLVLWIVALLTNIYCVSQIGWNEIREHWDWMPTVIHTRLLDTFY